MAGIADALDIERILEAHDPKTYWTMALVRCFGFYSGIEVDIDDVIEHAHCGADRRCEPFFIKSFFGDKERQVERAEVANSRLIFGGVEQDLCAQIR